MRWAGRVEDGRGSLGHAATPRFPSSLIETDMPISGIRLSDRLHRKACHRGNRQRHGGVASADTACGPRSDRQPIQVKTIAPVHVKIDKIDAKTSSVFCSERAKPSSPLRVMSNRLACLNRPSSHTTTSAKMWWRSIPITHLIGIPHRQTMTEAAGRHDTYGSALTAQPGESQRWPATNASSQLIMCIGLPALRAPGASVPDGRTICQHHAGPSRTSAPTSSYRSRTPSSPVFATVRRGHRTAQETHNVSAQTGMERRSASLYSRATAERQTNGVCKTTSRRDVCRA